ncbi:MAG: transporter substrate-binding domain-containing protein [Peptococcaceae bacterium]|nr:transporter substrate-binding domain-containing protein [Peptococcaceae bacterium]
MKLRFGVFLCFILSFMFPIFPISAEESIGNNSVNPGKIYRSATEYNYPPFSVINNGQADGFSVELLKEVAQEAGLQVDFKVDEWIVIKEELKNGELDILPLVSYSKERDEYYDFSVPYIVMYGNIFVHKNNDTITAEDDLYGKKIAVMKGDTAHEYALSRNLADNLILTSTFEEAFRKLDEGKCDAVLAQSLVGEKIIRDMGFDNVKSVYKLDDDGVSLVKTQLSGFEQKFCFAVREGDKELLAKLNEGLAVVSANGTYNLLYEKWFPFLIYNQPSFKESIKYLAVLMIPILLFVMIIFLIAVKQEVKRKTRELKSANEAKSRFLANMSHELRTPLNAILGYSALMQKDADLSEQSMKNLKIINKSGNHLLSLINDILEITKIESQKATVKKETFDFHIFIKNIEDMFALEVRSRNLTMKVEGLDRVPRYVFGDPLKLRIVLINLVGNAVKFTETGGITICFSVERLQQNHFNLLVEVKDTGVGISEDEKEKLFQHFSQTKSGLNVSKGTGLGLAISQENIKILGGKIKVESSLGQGSTFYFTVELQEISGPENNKDEMEYYRDEFIISEGESKLLVLVVEDSEDSRQLLTEIIKKSGCKVIEAEDGEQAVSIAQEQRPDFIWMDIRMPRMDGLTATRIIKNIGSDYSPAIVALSAHVFEEEKESILASGFDDLLGKPFAEKDVFRIMEKHLNIRFSQKASTDNQLSSALKILTKEHRQKLKDSILLLDQDGMLAIISEIELVSLEAAKTILREIEALNYTMLLKKLQEEGEF